MLTHPTLDKLHTLKCTGMAAALTEQMTLPDIDALTFEERLGLLVDREITEAGQPTHLQPAATRPTQTQCHPGGYRLSPPAGTG